ncbi:hypothetical protein [Microseira wollei]|uniref:hypothetical protein n=1 Tax=Microseira wollei TaxID=467598 RepID=UPI001CFC7E6A|nr:hypothetical protein [Microseira wollei]
MKIVIPNIGQAGCLPHKMFHSLVGWGRQAGCLPHKMFHIMSGFSLIIKTLRVSPSGASGASVLIMGIQPDMISLSCGVGEAGRMPTPQDVSLCCGVGVPPAQFSIYLYPPT